MEIDKVYFGDGVRRWDNIPFKNETEQDLIRIKLKEEAEAKK